MIKKLKFKNSNSNINLNKNKKAKLGLGIGLIVIAVLIPIIAQPKTTKTQSKTEKVETIRLKRKGEEITISRHGQVTIKTGDRLIMQYWDKNRITEIFSKFDEIGQSSFSREGTTIIIDLDNLEQAEELARLEIFSEAENEEIIELLASADTAKPTPTLVIPKITRRPVTPTGQPTNRLEYPTPTYYSQPGDGPTATQRPFRCIFEEPEEGENSFIISETVCTELID